MTDYMYVHTYLQCNAWAMLNNEQSWLQRGHGAESSNCAGASSLRAFKLIVSSQYGLGDAESYVLTLDSQSCRLDPRKQLCAHLVLDPVCDGI